MEPIVSGEGDERCALPWTSFDLGVGFENKICFEYLIVGLLQAQSFVSEASLSIVVIHVEAQATNIFACFGQRFDMVEQGPKHSTTSKRLCNVNTLDPPKITIAPIAPFVSDQ